MAKYHIRKDGLPGECKARAGSCPLSGEDEHFDSKLDAILAAEEKLREESDFLVSVKKTPVYHVSKTGSVDECPYRDGYCEVRPFDRFDNLHSQDSEVIEGAASVFREEVGNTIPDSSEIEEKKRSPEPKNPPRDPNGDYTSEGRKLIKDGYDNMRHAGWSEDEIRHYRDSCGHSMPPGRSRVPYGYSGPPIPKDKPKPLLDPWPGYGRC